MSKTVTPIVLNETDAIMLSSIVSGDLIAGAAVQKRARAILLLSEGKQINVKYKEGVIFADKAKVHYSGYYITEDDKKIHIAYFLTQNLMFLKAIN